jgi:tetratricopeptide (TPR) repeat protein
VFLNEAKIAADRLKQLQVYLDDVMALAAAACPPALMQFLGSDRHVEEMRALGRQPRASSCSQRGIWRPEDAVVQLEHAKFQLSNLQQSSCSSVVEDTSADRQSPLSDGGGNDSGGSASAAETTAISVMFDSNKLQLAACMHRVALLRVMASLCPPVKSVNCSSHFGSGNDIGSVRSAASHSPSALTSLQLEASSSSVNASSDLGPPLSFTSPLPASASIHLSPIMSLTPSLTVASPGVSAHESPTVEDKVSALPFQFQESSKLLGQAASICMAFGDAHGALAATSNLSVALLLDGRAEQALELCDRCIEAATKLGEVCCLVLVLSNAAYMYLSTGSCEAAVDAACAAMEGSRDSSESDIFRAFEVAMYIYLAIRDFAQVFAVGEQALHLLRPSKDVFGLAAVMYSLGCSFALQSYHAHAKDYFDQAAAQCRAVGDVQGLVLCLMGSSTSCSELGENEKGIQVSALIYSLDIALFHPFSSVVARGPSHLCSRGRCSV